MKSKNDLLKEVIYTIIQLIPIGKVVSYNDLAKLLKVHPRVIGRILSANKTPIIIPCHRVVRSNGDLGGYSGPGNIGFKRKLLELEGVIFDNDKVSKKSFWKGILKLECEK